MIITSTQDVRLLTREAFVDGARRHFGDHGRVLDGTITGVDVSVDVERPGETGFLVDLPVDGRAVNSDGTLEQDADVAAWVRSLVRPDLGRVIAFDGSWAWHVELVPGITPERFVAEMVDHSVAGWADGDPDLW